MAKQLEMPKLSPTMEEGVLTTWHKKEGDTIEVDDLLADVETDKATMEYRSFDAGTLLKLLVEPGATVKLGQPVAIIGAAGEDIGKLGAGSTPDQPGTPTKPEIKPNPESPEIQRSPSPPETPPQPSAPEISPTPASPEIVPSPASPDMPTTPTIAGPRTLGNVLTRTEREGARPPEPVRAAGSGGRALASPFVRKLAREQGVELSGVVGSGPHGRVVPDDLSQALKPAAQRAVASKPDEKKPLSMMRKTIARRLTESKQTVPHFYLQADLDAEALVAMREAVNADFAKLGDDVVQKLSVNDFLIKAVAVALRRVPECNASFTPEALIFHGRIDISVAVAVPDGLVTPVVRNADTLSVLEIGKSVRELATRAKNKKLTLEEMSGGTFSISNLGMFGIDSFSAVINPPEGAILAVGQVRDVPVIKDGEIAPGQRLAVTLSCDHRVIDGAVGAKFLAELRKLVEHPGVLLAL